MLFCCDGEDSNLRSSAYETDEMTTSLPRNLCSRYLYPDLTATTAISKQKTFFRLFNTTN